ncbi:flagellar hook protein FlgE [Sandarakinorhabdus rubra]|uniref:flagellar hook protein FlgE n=1 Tax=Sandarakinorhabdus rubra TaxID=2672568 RepID=UPI0013DC4924|nr:flagellar hook protein FlgE [Sandarakinorhabdus rubra]
MAFYTAFSGLAGAQTEMATIANNIANVSTTGFKRSRVSFGDIISTSPLQNPNRIVGSGTTVRSITQQFQQGPTETSTSALDLALAGPGFFVVKSGPGGVQTNFTRAGSFAVTADRMIVDTQGRNLQVFPTSIDGVVQSTSLASTVPARLPLTSGAPQATSAINVTVNLPSDAPIIANRPIYTPTNPYVFDRNDPATFNHSAAVTAYDSLGNPLAATIYYVKDSAASAADPFHRWTARAFVGNTELNVGGTPGIPLEFDLGGVLTNPTTPFAFDAFTPSSGGAAMAIAIDHGSATVQQAGPFNVGLMEQDGLASGQLESVSVDPDGLLRASFSNGEVQILGKVALATFSNPQGLKQTGDASWVVTPQSGEPMMGEGGRGGIGTILSGNLERSNVDLTTELVNLIAAQRNFQASAKAIETDNQLMQTIINLRN